jgi:hypothetical protein
MGRACSGYGERRGVYRVLVGKPEGKGPLWGRRRRWGIIIRWKFRFSEVGVWAGSIWLNISTGGVHL